MTTIWLYEFEAWPAYKPEDEPEGGRVELEVPDEVAERWRRAYLDYEAACGEMGVAYRAMRPGPGEEFESPYPGRYLP